MGCRVQEHLISASRGGAGWSLWADRCGAARRGGEAAWPPTVLVEARSFEPLIERDTTMTAKKTSPKTTKKAARDEESGNFGLGENGNFLDQVMFRQWGSEFLGSQPICRSGLTP